MVEAGVPILGSGTQVTSKLLVKVMQKKHGVMQNFTRRNWLQMGVWGTVVSAVPFTTATAQARIKVLAASDLQFALTRIAAQYQQETGQLVEVTYGSSGNMARQIQQGLVADMFLSADESFVQQVANAGLTHKQSQGTLYALGRLALMTGVGVQVELDERLVGVRKAGDTIRKFAIANPEHAPYGRAAREALQSLNLWTALQPRLVLGDNISQTAQFIVTGAAQAGIVALSLAMAPELQGRGRSIALPETLHQPLRQRMVLLKNASETAQSFYAYLQQDKARTVLAQYGFAPPP